MPQRLSPVPLAELVPETQLWNEGNGIDLESWIGFRGNMELAIGFGELFWPDYLEVNGCIFRASDVDEQDAEWYERTLRSLDGDETRLEKLRNHLHIWDLFPRDATEPPPTRIQCLYLARLLREMWEAKLRREFPDRDIQVIVNDQDEEGDFQITFFQNRKPANG